MMLHNNKLAKLTLEFDNELLSFSHFKNYPNYLPYIGKDYSNSKKKILIIAESHFYPDEDFYKNIDINDFYNKKVDFKDLNFMFTRFELTRIEKHRIHQILEKFVNYEEIAYYNFFLRPASNKKSLIVKAIDKEYSNNAFKVITNALCPDKIIFVSKKSFDALSIENKKTYKEKIFYCVHPNSFWWHKTMKKYGNKKGKEIFKSILNNESKN